MSNATSRWGRGVKRERGRTLFGRRRRRRHPHRPDPLHPGRAGAREGADHPRGLQLGHPRRARARRRAGRHRAEACSPTARTFVNGTTIVTNAITELRGAKVGVLITRGFRDTFRIAGGRAAQRLRRPRAGQPAGPGRARVHRRDHRAQSTPKATARPGGRRGGGAAPRSTACARRASRRSPSATCGRSLRPGQRAAHARAHRRALPRGLRHPLLGDPPGDPRVRAIHDRGLQLPLRPRHAPATSTCSPSRLEAAGLRRNALLLPGHRRRGPANARCGERPITLLASGPAGGVMAARYFAEQMDVDNVLVGDMGGTSFDTAVLKGREVHVAKRTTVNGLLDRDLDRRHRLGRRRRRQHRRSTPAASPRSGRTAPARSRALPATGAAASEATVTDAMVDPRLDRPRQLPRRALRARRRRRAPRDRRADRDAARARRSTTRRRRSTTSRSPTWPTRCARSASSAATTRATSPSSPTAGPCRSSPCRCAAGSAARRSSSRQPQLGLLGLRGPDRRLRARATTARSAGTSPTPAGFDRGQRVPSGSCASGRSATPPRRALTRRSLALEPSADFRFVGQVYEVTMPLPDRALDAGDGERLSEEFLEAYERTYGKGTAWKGSPTIMVNLLGPRVGTTSKPPLGDEAPDALGRERAGDGQPRGLPARGEGALGGPDLPRHLDSRRAPCSRARRSSRHATPRWSCRAARAREGRRTMGSESPSRATTSSTSRSTARRCTTSPARWRSR